jgi:hypothetical protein
MYMYMYLYIYMSICICIDMYIYIYARCTWAHSGHDHTVDFWNIWNYGSAHLLYWLFVSSKTFPKWTPTPSRGQNPSPGPPGGKTRGCPTEGSRQKGQKGTTQLGLFWLFLCVFLMQIHVNVCMATGYRYSSIVFRWELAPRGSSHPCSNTWQLQTTPITPALTTALGWILCAWTETSSRQQEIYIYICIYVYNNDYICIKSEMDRKKNTVHCTL